MSSLLEFLHEAVAGARRIGMLADGRMPSGLAELGDAARHLNFDLDRRRQRAGLSDDICNAYKYHRAASIERTSQRSMRGRKRPS